MKEQRSDRVKEWSSFMDKMCEKSAAVDEEYQNEVQRVEQYYKDLEQKLKITEQSS